MRAGAAAAFASHLTRPPPNPDPARAGHVPPPLHPHPPPQGSMNQGHFPPRCRTVLVSLLDRATTKYSLNAPLARACAAGARVPGPTGCALLLNPPQRTRQNRTHLRVQQQPHTRHIPAPPAPLTARRGADSRELCGDAVDEVGGLPSGGGAGANATATAGGGSAATTGTSSHHEETVLACLARSAGRLAPGCLGELQGLVKLSLGRYRCVLYCCTHTHTHRLCLCTARAHGAGRRICALYCCPYLDYLDYLYCCPYLADALPPPHLFPLPAAPADACCCVPLPAPLQVVLWCYLLAHDLDLVLVCTSLAGLPQGRHAPDQPVRR